MRVNVGHKEPAESQTGEEEMKMFSDCRGPCQTCQVYYIGGCLAGHGDDDYVHATADWIKQFYKEKEKKDRVKK